MTQLRLRLAAILATCTLLALTIGLAPARAAKTPSWQLHVKNYSGGISNGVRERLAVASGETTSTRIVRAATPSLSPLENVQMNEDFDPPLPQDEPGIAVNLENPLNAVAAANDYIGDGFWIGYTIDGGHTWTSQLKEPKFSFDEGRCFGSDPGVAYSLRDHAFYISTLFYF